ncbi:MAG: PA0069 family radical SAM protein [Candidatus Hydrogenedentota bacterium]
MLLNQPTRGRGTAHNVPNRFIEKDVVPYDDADWLEDEESPRPKTLFLPDASKSILSYNASPDVGFDASVNPYRGCEHGCAYCYARPTHEYLDFSAGLDFETRIMVKHHAANLLRSELRAKKWISQLVGLSGVTDCYQPIERELKLTRSCLEVFRDFRNPVVIITKNRMVTRDIDILKEMTETNCVRVFVSVTTLDLGLNRTLEPRTSSPSQRLEAIRQLSDAGISVGALVAPIIPGLNDHEIPTILEAVADAGADFASYIVLRLPHAVAPLFDTWLEQHAPGQRDKVLNRMRSMRGGKIYDSDFKQRMRGSGIHAEQIATLFRIYKQKYHLELPRETLATEHFRVPVQPGDQMTLA